jgi:hypothetical protein
MDEEAKVKHSKRIQQKQNYVKKQTKIAKAHGLPVKLGEEHRLQDHAAMNCGIPKCPMCMNPRRQFKEKTIQEKSFEQTEKWVAE